MERLTKVWGNGEYGLVNAFVTTNADVCNALGRYEDEAERCEQGCEQCRSCANCGNYDPICPVMLDSVVCANEERIMENKECVNFRPAGYCWSCGKKLAELEIP